LPRLGSAAPVSRCPQSVAVLLSSVLPAGSRFCTTASPGPGWRIRPAGGSANPAAEERSIRTPSGFPRSDDQEIPFLAQRLAPAIAQIDDAGSKPSLTTVASMLD